MSNLMIFGLQISILLILTLVMITFYTTNNNTTTSYLDNNGTTKIFDESLELMSYVYQNYYGNASGVYSLGAKSKKLLEVCRTKLAKLLNCELCEIFFTSGATESNNIALRGIFAKNKSRGKHVITTSIEHPSVYETVKTLEGADVTFLNVDKYGKINLQELQNSIRKDTILVSIIMGNNEIGTLQDMKSIAKICRDKGVHCHCDMTQVVGKYKIDMSELNIDSATGSGHKFHGPKATGFLYLKKGTYFESCISGGHQEKNIRSGTENIPGIVAMVYSLYLCYRRLDIGQNREIKYMRDWMKDALLKNIPDIVVNGHPTDTLYNTLSVCLPTNSRKVVEFLDKHGVYVNTGSACSKGTSSSVLDAIGLHEDIQQGSLRISLGFLNTWKDCVNVVKLIILYVKSHENPSIANNQLLISS